MDTNGGGPRARVLVVDDERTICATIAKYLNKIGYIAMAVTSGLEALAAMEEFRPDVIVIDYKMPGLNGLDTIRKIRETPFDGCIIIATASEVELIRHAGENLGVSEFISKPISLDALQTIIERICKKRSSMKP